MFVSQQKLHENISEFIIYMFTIENIIRALDYNIDKIYNAYIIQMSDDKEVQSELKDWYKKFTIELYQKDRDCDNLDSHLSVVEDKIEKLYETHTSIINENIDNQYIECYKTALPHINSLKEKINKDLDAVLLNDIEICFIGIFGLYTLKLKKQNITSETNLSANSIIKFISYLSKKYKEINQ